MKENPLKFYAKYSSLALQMGVIIVAGAFGGREIDKHVNWKFPVFTLILTILSVIVALVYGMRELFRMNKHEKNKQKKNTENE
jgi:membrane protein DedA with SNARE-associated domain